MIKHKIILMGICAILLIGIVSALDLGVTPAYTSIKGITGEKICTDITLDTSMSSIALTFEDKWSSKFESRELSDYFQTAADYKLTSEYDKSMNLIKKVKMPFCVVAQKPGIYNGVLIIKSSKIAGLGVWIKVEVTGEDLYAKSLITGETIKAEPSAWSKYSFPLVVTAIVSFVALMVLWNYGRKMKKKMDNNKDEQNLSSEWEENKN